MKKQTLHRQFRIWTILLVVVPSLLIIAIYTIGQISTVKQKKLEIISQRVDFQKNLIEYWIEERASDVRKISQLTAFRQLDEADMKSTLALMQQHSKDFDSLSYIDKDGYFRMSTLVQGIRFTSTVGQPYFEAAVAGKEYISDVVIGRNSGLPIINFSAPIYDNYGNFQGLILGSVRTTTIEAMLRENWMGETGEIILVNRDGEMIAEPRYVNMLINKGLTDSIPRKVVKLSDRALMNIQLGSTGSANWVDYMERKVLGAYKDMPEREWTLIGSISEEEILAPIYNRLAMMAGGTFLLVLLILPLATRLTNQIKRPIEWLIAQSEYVATENYAMINKDVCAGNIPREIDALCNTFIQMSSKIENTISLLKENEANLESKVLEIQDINNVLAEEIMERQLVQAALQKLNIELENKVNERTGELRSMNAALAKEVGERQTAQEAMRKFFLFFLHSRDIMLFVNRTDGKIIEANPAAENAYGYSRQELLNMYIFNLRADEDQRLICKQMNIADSEGIRFESIHCCKDGRQFPVEVESRGEKVGVQSILFSVIRDISERKLAEAALRHNEQQFRGLIRSLPTAVMISRTKDDALLYLNEQAGGVFKVRNSEGVFGQSILSYWVNLADRAKMIALLQEYETVSNFQTKLRRRDNDIFWASINARFIQFEGNRALFAAVTDIDERKRAEEDKLQRERQFREVLNTAPVGVVITSKKDRSILFVNDSAVKMGVSIEISGQSTVPFYVNPEDRDKLIAILERDCSFKDIEIQLKSQKREPFWTLISANVTEFEGQPAIVATIVDISERKRAEKELYDTNKKLERETKIKSALASLSAAITSPNTADNEMFRLVLDNARLLTESEHSYIATVDSQKSPELSCCLMEVAKGECTVPFVRYASSCAPHTKYHGLWNMSLTSKTPFFTNNPVSHPAYQGLPKGHISLRNFLSIPVIFGESLLGCMALANSARDYTEADLEIVERLGELYAVALWNRRRENDLKVARDNAEVASRAKSAFLANMSHEVRTPMTGILISSELLLSLRIPPEIEEQVRHILAGAKSMVAILDEVLEFTQLEAGVIRIKEQSYSLTDLTLTTVFLISSKAQAKGLSLEVSIDPNLPAWIRGDVVRIRQVLTNLLDNAVKFTSDGQIIISISLIGEAAGSKQFIKFAVSDTGPGISRENSERIFDRFFQVDAASTRRYGGIGLGLSIVKSLVEIMGGRLHLDSEVGKGSTFWFVLPLEPTAMPQDTTNASSVAAVEGLRVLIVDDNEMNRKIIRKLLERMGVETDEAQDGLAALKKLENNKYDVVLMDIQMPGLNGYETVRMLRSGQGQATNRDVIVVALTAGGLAGERERCLNAGMDGYLVKPFTMSQLGAVLTGTNELRPEKKTTSAEIFDSAKLCEYVGGNFESYQECIKRFPVVIGPLLAELSAAVQADNWREGCRLAHTLKGAAANFAATRLHRTLCILEESLRTAVGDYLESLRAVEEEYQLLLERLQVLRDE